METLHKVWKTWISLWFIYLFWGKPTYFHPKAKWRITSKVNCEHGWLACAMTCGGTKMVGCSFLQKLQKSTAMPFLLRKHLRRHRIWAFHISRLPATSTQPSFVSAPACPCRPTRCGQHLRWWPSTQAKRATNRKGQHRSPCLSRDFSQIGWNPTMGKNQIILVKIGQAKKNWAVVKSLKTTKLKDNRKCISVKACVAICVFKSSYNYYFQFQQEIHHFQRKFLAELLEWQVAPCFLWCPFPRLEAISGNWGNPAKKTQLQDFLKNIYCLNLFGAPFSCPLCFGGA